MWYITVSMADPELVNVWFRVVVPVALLAQPVTFPELGVQVQVNVVPAIAEVRVRFVATPLHCCLESGVLERFGEG